ncbi:S-receptor-like serine/threonine-protein kinase [Trema orientale]|uniref:Receptor-like serine/threonine-protein kinase n=1 Tax=Trema orientale TaxID=63057 RepID=A0A2P5BB99_TREOI|nr:S-receptor-like serine/threonine-protein kinase [Trema orientale]
MDAQIKPVMFIFSLLCLFLKTLFSQGADTISTNQSLSGEQTVVSVGRKFELGFFKPGKSSNYYIGMWHKRDLLKTILWVANREKPVSDKFSSVLKITDGNLVLFSESRLPVWSTNVKSTTSASVQAVLLDTGNLILNKIGSSLLKKRVLWQSFDHPTHTFIHDSKLGYNKITKNKQRLTSWKNLEDPSQGHFSFELDPSDNSFTMQWTVSSWNYWSSGPWDGEIFSQVPEMRLNGLCYFKYIPDDNGSYFTHSLINSSTVSQFFLDVSGQIRQQLWLPTTGWKLLWSFPRQQCQVYAFCGAYGSCSEKSLPFCSCLPGFRPKYPREWNLMDYSNGCLRKGKHQCSNVNNNGAHGQRDRFLAMPGMSFPENGETVTARSVVDCESACLNDCSCVAYAYDNSRCSIWVGDLLNLRQFEAGDSSGRALFIRVAASDFPSPKNKRGAVVVIGSAVGLALFLGLIVLIVLRRIRRAVGATKALAGSLVVFGYRDLQNATKNFSEKIGGGGFGSVFKGTLPDSTTVAVKKLQSVSQGEKEFRTEVSIIGTIQHINLVRLRGFCCKGTKRLLVYEFVSNGSLASHLFHQNKLHVLEWKRRYQIALGIARGLVYLHEKCRDCIIHCDIKPENIPEFCPKVGDFGLAKHIGREFSRVLTTMRGTRGYLAPEWIAGVAITSKADVYSYGMMLFEFVSGRRNSEQFESDGKLNYFPSLAAKVVVEGGNVLGLLDPKLEGNADIEEVERVCKVACWCIQDNEAHRPSMGQVVQILEGIIEVKLPPVPQYLHFYDDNEENVVCF